jgi:hypothetical protein
VRVYRCYINDLTRKLSVSFAPISIKGHRLVKFWTLPEGKGPVLRDNAIRSSSVLLVLSDWKIPPSRIWSEPTHFVTGISSSMNRTQMTDAMANASYGSSFPLSHDAMSFLSSSWAPTSLWQIAFTILFMLVVYDQCKLSSN